MGETTLTNKANPRSLTYVGIVPGPARDSIAWFTPERYLKAVQKALDGIEFDPFSCEEANKLVKAKLYYTEKDDALKKPWGYHRSVFMNPPYGRGLCNKSVKRFCEQHDHGMFEVAIILVNNATETHWFQDSLARASAICFVDHRISFWNAGDKFISGNTRGQVFFYFGKSTRKFTQAFRGFGFTTILKGKH